MATLYELLDSLSDASSLAHAGFGLVIQTDGTSGFLVVAVPSLFCHTAHDPAQVLRLVTERRAADLGWFLVGMRIAF